MDGPMDGEGDRQREEAKKLERRFGSIVNQPSISQSSNQSCTQISAREVNYEAIDSAMTAMTAFPFSAAT